MSLCENSSTLPGMYAQKTDGFIIIIVVIILWPHTEHK